MTRHRIAVGLDASEPARRALRWAVREAVRTGAGVLVVTAWPAADRATAGRTDGLFAARLRLQRMQSDRIAEAIAGLDRPPLIAREIVLADPVTALCHAARFAGIIAIGSRSRLGLGPDSVAVSVARRLGRRRQAEPAPLVVATAPAPRRDVPPAVRDVLPAVRPTADGTDRRAGSGAAGDRLVGRQPRVAISAVRSTRRLV